MTPEELVRTAGPMVNELGWTFYFTPETTARGEAMGLDVFELYFLGRGGVLGDVGWRVVDAAFGYFKPAVVEAMWDAARAKVGPIEAADAYLAAAHDHGRRLLGGVDGLGEWCAAAEAVVAAVDPAACALFAGLASMPLPEDPPARAMQLLVTLREHRGGVHLIAVVASGLRPVVAHQLRRPEMMRMFGWAREDIPETTDGDRARLRAADELTDALLLPAYGAPDAGQREVLHTGLLGIKAALAG